jgi:Domain of unknown function (DUF4168)
MTAKWVLALLVLFWANNVQANPLIGKQGYLVAQTNQASPITQIAQAQFSEEKINNYARAVLAIEMKRAEILQRAMSSSEWAIAAQKASARGITVCDMSKEEQTTMIQALCKELFSFAEQERRRQGFEKNSEFNQMTRALQQDNQLQERVRRKMSELTGNK